METIEIRKRKKTVLPFLALAVFLIAITFYMVFFNEQYEGSSTTKIFVLLGLAYFVYSVYLPVKILLKNEPVLVFTSQSILINTSAKVVNRTEIKKISVQHVKDVGYFLNIVTEKETHEVNISWLEKTPDEIKELIIRYPD